MLEKKFAKNSIPVLSRERDGIILLGHAGNEPKAFLLPALHPSQGSTELKGFMELSRALLNPQRPTEVDTGVPSEALLITVSPQLASPFY